MAESASASIAFVQLTPVSFQYTITLHDTGTTPIGTFWFSWVPGAGYLPDLPSFSDPAGWHAVLTDGPPPSNGYSIQWVATSPGDAVASGGSFAGFVFTSATAPSVMFGTSTIHPPIPVMTSVVYSAAPFSDAGFTLVVACFAEGSRILTDTGEIAVERLAVGDRVATLGGRLAPIRWLGHRRIDCARHPRPQDVWPVRVRAGAFAPHSPARDLLLSPDHAVFAGGALIPVRYLVNGATIAQEPVDRVTYWHVELPAHDVILAEGLPTESYLDTGNRAAFANGGAIVRMQPDFALDVWERQACAKLVVDGPVLAAVRTELLARAGELGCVQTEEPDLHLLADGAPVWPEIEGETYRFDVPPGTASLRLVSRSAIPAEMCPFSHDTRRVGVAVERLLIDGMDSPPGDSRRAAGWHPPESGWQWTDGDAVLDASKARRIEVTNLPVIGYWAHAAPRRRPFVPAPSAGFP